MGEVFKIKPFFQEFHFCGLRFPVGIESGQYAVIFPQFVIDVPDEVFTVPVQPVVIGVPAMIAAKFLVGPAGDLLFAFQAGTGHYFARL